MRIHDKQLLFNGRPILLKGVNRHEHDETTGKVLTLTLPLTLALALALTLLTQTL